MRVSEVDSFVAGNGVMSTSEPRGVSVPIGGAAAVVGRRRSVTSGGGVISKGVTSGGVISGSVVSQSARDAATPIAVGRPDWYNYIIPTGINLTHQRDVPSVTPLLDLACIACPPNKTGLCPTNKFQKKRTLSLCRAQRDKQISGTFFMGSKPCFLGHPINFPFTSRECSDRLMRFSILSTAIFRWNRDCCCWWRYCCCDCC